MMKYCEFVMPRRRKLAHNCISRSTTRPMIGYMTSKTHKAPIFVLSLEFCVWPVIWTDFLQSFNLFNPYWQIMENSSRNFSEISFFRVVTQAVLLENSSIRIFWLKPHIWSGWVFQIKRPVWRPRILQLTIGWVFQ